MNVGASSPEEYGIYYQWGSPLTPTGYTISFCPWLGANSYIAGGFYEYSDLRKYCTKSNYGTVDNITRLELQDDAAYVNMDTTWRTPTRAEAEELMEKCTWEWTTVNDVTGFQVTGPNGNSIFLPAGGGHRSWGSGELAGEGNQGFFWTSDLNKDAPSGANALYFSYYYGEGKPAISDFEFRHEGLNVRGVKR